LNKYFKHYDTTALIKNQSASSISAQIK